MASALKMSSEERHRALERTDRFTLRDGKVPAKHRLLSQFIRNCQPLSDSIALLCNLAIICLQNHQQLFPKPEWEDLQQPQQSLRELLSSGFQHLHFDDKQSRQYVEQAPTVRHKLPQACPNEDLCPESPTWGKDIISFHLLKSHSED